MIVGVFSEFEEFQEFVAFQPHYYRILVEIVFLEQVEDLGHSIPKMKGHFAPCHKRMSGKIHWEFVYD